MGIQSCFGLKIKFRYFRIENAFDLSAIYLSKLFQEISWMIRSIFKEQKPIFHQSKLNYFQFCCKLHHHSNPQKILNFLPVPLKNLPKFDLIKNVILKYNSSGKDWLKNDGEGVFYLPLKIIGSTRMHVRMICIKYCATAVVPWDQM